MYSSSSRQKTPARVALQLLACAVVAAATSSCSAPRQVEYERRLGETAAGARHAVHDERLQELMRGMRRLSADRLPQGMDVEGQRRLQANEIAEIALALSKSASRIPEAGRGASLSPAERVEFEALARQLQERAAALAQAAEHLSADEAVAQLAAIDRTCQACHARFRTRQSP